MKNQPTNPKIPTSKQTEYTDDDFAHEEGETPKASRKASESVRVSRHSEGRAQTARVKKERPAITISLGSRFNLPKEILDDPDYVYGWVAYSCSGEELQQGVEEAFDSYWLPVPKDEYPTLSRRYISDVFGRKEEDQLIRKGGQILMKREREIDDEFNKAYNERNERDQEMKNNYVLFDRSSRFYSPGRSAY